MPLPTEAQQALDGVVSKLKQHLGENLHAVFLYGSAVRGNWVSGVSDINILLVLKESTPEAHAAIGACLKCPIPIAPFVLGLRGLDRSLNSFATKFRSIKRAYQVLHGADFLANWNANPELVRFLTEQALRNTRLRHKLAFIKIGHDPEKFHKHLLDLLPNVFVNLSEVLRCKQIEVPYEYKERLPLYEKTFGTDVTILADLIEMKSKKAVIKVEEVKLLHARLYKVLDGAIIWMETQWPESPLPKG